MTDTDDGLSTHLYVVQMFADGLARFGELQGAVQEHLENRRLIHRAFCEIFGDRAPHPFDVGKQSKRGSFLVLAYGDQEATELKEVAKQRGTVELAEECIDWKHFSSRTLPTPLPEGMEFEFEARVCPMAADSAHEDGELLDVFSAEVQRLGDDEPAPSREAVYCRWFAEWLDEHDAAELVEVSMKRCSIQRLARRGEGGSPTAMMALPDVVLEGVVQVVDGPGFVELLQRTVGAYSEFGFGMLKVRPGDL